MAKKKTSAEVAREQSEIAKVEGMLGDAFGGLGGRFRSSLTNDEACCCSEEAWRRKLRTPSVALHASVALPVMNKSYRTKKQSANKKRNISDLGYFMQNPCK